MYSTTFVRMFTFYIPVYMIKHVLPDSYNALHVGLVSAALLGPIPKVPPEQQLVIESNNALVGNFMSLLY